MKTLEESEEIVGCSICKTLANELRKRKGLSTELKEISIQARLSLLKDLDNLALKKVSGDQVRIPHIYQLDFELAGTKPLLRTFALNPTSKFVPKLFP
jgi:hypothetical protein